MLNSFIIVLREGFESFLLVAVILAYLRKAGQQWLNSSVYIGIAAALAASASLAYVLNTGVDDETIRRIFGDTIGGPISTFFANEALREAGPRRYRRRDGCHARDSHVAYRTEDSAADA
jgi:high-affinity iron transporter